MIQFILIRHGETVWTKEKRYQGRMNTPLTGAGKRQMQRYASEIVKIQPDVIFTSDLGRCQESAKIFCKPLKKTAVIDSRLGEMGFGEWEGKTAGELLKENNPAYAKWIHGERATPRGGESIKAVHKRIRSFIRDCQKNYDNKRVVIVTHGGPIRVFMLELLKLPATHMFQFRIDPGSVTVIEKHRDFVELVLLNSTTTLKGIVPVERN